jgi:hypothetical protein
MIRRICMAALATVLLTSCGVRLDAVPQPIPLGAIPTVSVPTSAPASPTVPSAGRVRVWFVQEDGLVPVVTDLSREPIVAPGDVVAALAAGPPPEQADEGVRSLVVDPITDAPLASVSADAPVTEAGSVVVVLAPAASALPPGEQVLLLGQLVLSLTGAGYASVTFVDEAGALAAVPLPGGRLLDRPAVARDYAGLIIEL